MLKATVFSKAKPFDNNQFIYVSYERHFGNYGCECQKLRVKDNNAGQTAWDFSRKCLGKGYSIIDITDTYIDYSWYN